MPQSVPDRRAQVLSFRRAQVLSFPRTVQPGPVQQEPVARQGSNVVRLAGRPGYEPRSWRGNRFFVIAVAIAASLFLAADFAATPRAADEVDAVQPND